MNFILTLKCNKHCPYCFAAESRAKEKIKVMELETFKKLFAKVPPNSRIIKLLGGEPTLHPNFKEIVDIVLARNFPLTIITNLLSDEDIFRFLAQKYYKKYNINFLINATDLDINNRLDKWVRNYKIIHHAAYKNDMEMSISIGLTLQNENNVNYYIDYLNTIIDRIKLVDTVRLSLPFPANESEKENFFFINNKKLGEKFLKICSFLIQNGIQPDLDCCIYPCVFENKEYFKLMLKFVKNFKTSCTGIPADVFPDETMSHCYPLRNILKVNVNKYKTLLEALEDLKRRYNVMESLIMLPKECQQCGFRNSGLCHGPCLANFKINSNLGINL